MKKQEYFYLIFTLFFLAANQKFAQESIKTSFEITEGKVFIYYELTGEKEKEYEIKIKLKRTSRSSFEVIPLDLTGDIGIGKYAGRKNTIIWQLNEKEKNSLDGDDFYFEITAQKISSGGMSWLYYVGGALIGGGAAAVLVLNKKNNGNENQTTSSNLPTPPLRP